MTAVMVAAVVAVLVVVVATWQSRAAFAERFPPISDAEFLARCRPGTSPEVALKVRRIVARHFAVEYERVHPCMCFVEDLGAD
jgi:hypothetical protein